MQFNATKVDYPHGVTGKKLEYQTPLGTEYKSSCDRLEAGETICLGNLSLPMREVEPNGKGYYVTTSAGKFLLTKQKKN